MPAPKAIWAVDIGQCALKALHAKMIGDDIEIDSYVIIPHEQILSQPDADEPALIRKTLQKFVAQHTVGKDTLVISVPGHRSFARFSKLPPVEPKKIPDIVHYEATQQIPFGIDEVVWDYHVFKNESSPDVEVGIFAIKRSIISQYLGYFQELNLHPVSIQTAPVALYNACAFEGLTGKEATIIADVGAQNTNFLIAEDHRLWLRNIPLGGNNFTEALQKSFKLDFAKAEELKCTAATSKYARAVFQAMRPIFSDLSSEFQRSNGFYTSINREAQISQLYALGSAFKLPGLLKFLQQNLNMPVKKLETFSKVKLAGSINEAEFSDNVLTLGVAYGLMVQAMGRASVNTDLMPPEIMRDVAWQGKQYWFVGAAACLLLAAGAIWMRGISDASAVQTDKDQIQQVMSSVNKFSSLKSEYQQNSNLEGAKDPLVEDFQKISDNRLVLPEIMQVINQSLPVPQKQLTATAPAEYKKAAKAVERSERTQVLVEKLNLDYVPDLTEDAIKQIEQANKSASSLTVNRVQEAQGGGMMGGPGMMPGMMGGPGMMGPGMGGPGMGGGPGMMGPGMGGPGMGGPGMGGPGMMGGGMGGGGLMMQQSKGSGGMETEGKKAFIVTLKGTTPHANAPEFLTNQLMKKLRTYDKKWALKNKKTFWVDHVNLVSCQQPLIPVSEQETMKKSGSKLDDPVTEESMVNDAAFSMVFVVNLGQPPAEEAEGQGTRTPGMN
jgi:type IV pilus assembly protein PilM